MIPVYYDGFEIQCASSGHHGHKTQDCMRLQPNLNCPPPVTLGPTKPHTTSAPKPTPTHQRPHSYPNWHCPSHERGYSGSSSGHAYHGRGPHQPNMRGGRWPYQRLPRLPLVDADRFTLVEARRRPSQWDVRPLPALMGSKTMPSPVHMSNPPPPPNPPDEDMPEALSDQEIQPAPSSPLAQKRIQRP